MRVVFRVSRRLGASARHVRDRMLACIEHGKRRRFGTTVARAGRAAHREFQRAECGDRDAAVVRRVHGKRWRVLKNRHARPDFGERLAAGDNAGFASQQHQAHG